MSQHPESGPPVMKLYAIELPDGSVAMNGPYILATENEGQAGRMAHARDGQEIAFVRELQQAQAMGGDVARLMELVYVPGAWRCPKCNLRLIASTLSMGDGGMYANNEPQECANGCGSMWRVTEREDRQEAQRFAIEQAEALATPQSSAPVVGDDDIDRMRDVYMSVTQREAYERILKAALTGRAE